MARRRRKTLERVPAPPLTHRKAVRALLAQVRAGDMGAALVLADYCEDHALPGWEAIRAVVDEWRRCTLQWADESSTTSSGRTRSVPRSQQIGRWHRSLQRRLQELLGVKVIRLRRASELWVENRYLTPLREEEEAQS